MKIKDIVTPLEQFAPLSWQEVYDNSGLLVGDSQREVSSALLCVDVTDRVLDEAERLGAGLVISHHPIIFHPLKRFTGRSNVERVVERAICNGIALYACHTNLDRAVMSLALAEKLGLKNVQVLDPAEIEGGTGFGAIGELAEPAAPLDFLRSVASTLGAGCIRHSAPVRKIVQRVALITGSGGEGLEKAIERGADVFMSADLRFDRFFAAEKRILLADIGHFESEFCAIDLMYDIISKKIATFALHKSADSHNPVNYLV